MVMEAQSPIAELLAKDPVLLAKVVNDLQLALIPPSGNGDQQKAEWVENSLGFQSLLSQLQADGETIANSCGSSFRTIRGRTESAAEEICVGDECGLPVFYRDLGKVDILRNGSSELPLLVNHVLHRPQWHTSHRSLNSFGGV
jgi:hypothetical protein